MAHKQLRTELLHSPVGKKLENKNFVPQKVLERLVTRSVVRGCLPNADNATIDFAYKEARKVLAIFYMLQSI